MSPRIHNNRILLKVYSKNVIFYLRNTIWYISYDKLCIQKHRCENKLPQKTYQAYKLSSQLPVDFFSQTNFKNINNKPAFVIVVRKKPTNACMETHILFIIIFQLTDHRCILYDFPRVTHEHFNSLLYC